MYAFYICYIAMHLCTYAPMQLFTYRYVYVTACLAQTGLLLGVPHRLPVPDFPQSGRSQRRNERRRGAGRRCSAVGKRNEGAGELSVKDISLKIGWI